MKKVLNILSILGIIVAPAVIGVLYSFETKAPQTKAEAGQAIDAEDFLVNQPRVIDFQAEDFPLNQPRLIDFQVDQRSLEWLTQRQQQNQLRDWLLLTIVSSQKLSTDEINQNLDHLPTFRYGYGKPLPNLQYGKTRSLYLGKGQVVTLLPKDISKQERMDNLAQIADQHRQDLGKIPTSLVVFEYEINPDQQFALVTKREILDTKKIFTKGNYGYHEAQINSLDALERFLKQVDYLTFAQINEYSLTLGGRKLSSRQSLGISVEDVAAIWQSEQKIQNRGSGFSLEPSYDYLSFWQSEQKIQNRGSGFSLEPSYDYRSLEKFFTQKESLFQSLTVGEAPAITQNDIQLAKDNLAQNNEIPYLTLANKLARNNNPDIAKYGDLAIAEAINNRFQIARYGGDLQGTEVGMILFYTDILAKLFAIDYLSNTPEGHIAKFNPPKKLKVSSIYKHKVKELSSIRLMFGIDNKDSRIPNGYKSLFFAPNATQIYAASYNPLQPSAKKTILADSYAFLAWWNDHYEEVLIRYEPQYEQLNEIIKWGRLISWLNHANKGEILGFLQEVKVKRDHWFPNWARAKSNQLKFPIWNHISFYKRGYKGTKTEAMPSLGSKTSGQIGKQKFVSGEVLLVKRFRFRSPRVRPRPVRRPGRVNPPRPVTPPGRVNPPSPIYFPVTPLPDSPPTKVSPPPKDPVKATAQAKEDVKFPSLNSEFVNPKLNRKISNTISGLHIENNVDGTYLGSLELVRTENGFKVGWMSQDIIQEQFLVWKLNQDINNTGDLGEALSKNPNVEGLVMVPEDPPSYLVKIENSNPWLKVVPESRPNHNGSEGRSYRLVSLKNNSDKIVLSWVDEQMVRKQLAEGVATSIIYDQEKLEFAALADDLYHEKYDKIALELVKNYQTLKGLYDYKLKQVDALIQTKDYAKAAQAIDNLISRSGKRPDLMLRKAVIDIGRNRQDIELVLPSQQPIGKEQMRKKFFDEVNELLERNKSRVKFGNFKKYKAFFYVEDNPGLNNIDPSLPIEQSIPLISAKARVYKLVPGEIGDVKLSMSGFGETIPSSDLNVSQNTDSLRPRYRSQNNECNNNQEVQGECKNEQEVQDDSQKPIYIVIEPNNA